MDRDNIVLTGYPGAGKTTVSLALGRELDGWTVVDTDVMIEEREGRSIPELFEAKGEAYFRQAESRVIAEVMEKTRQIVSTGGGAVLAAENRLAMKRGGFVVALKASADVIISRVRENENRPLLRGDVETRVRRLLEERKHAYDFADLTIDTSGLPVEEVVRLILEERACR